MADIFISYRHGTTDSWAADNVARRLEEHFSVFFDLRRGSLELGDVFPTAIEDALNDARIVLAVIGPDWCSKEGLRRLRRENDWVRRELGLTLGRSDVRVVPLIIEPARLPDAASLPGDLAPLVERQARQLSPATLDDDADVLVQRLRDWLGGRSAALERVAQAPPALPYLCDRKDQEEAFVEMAGTIDPATNVLTCVVHGHRWECHDELLQRFQCEGVLEDTFGMDDGVGIFPVQLNRAKLRAGLFREALASAMKADVVGRRTATDDDLRAWLSAILQPLVVVVQFTWSDYQEIGERLVPDLVQAWNGLLRPGDPAQAARPARPVVLWINLTYEEDDRELPRAVLFSPLPKLSSVEERHIREWLVLRKVHPHVAARKQELLQLPLDRDYCHAPGQLHMMRFAEAVNRILAAP
jgi:hypothetical protein